MLHKPGGLRYVIWFIEDVDGYAKALSEFDKWLPEFMNERGMMICL